MLRLFNRNECFENGLMSVRVLAFSFEMLGINITVRKMRKPASFKPDGSTCKIKRKYNWLGKLN